MSELKVLVVDDIAQMSQVVVDILKDLGFERITTASNGKEALEALEVSKGNDEYNLVLSDWNMPILPGIDLLREIKQNPKYYDLPFIMMTTESEKDKILDAITLGINNYIFKPITHDVLKEKVFQTLEIE